MNDTKDILSNQENDFGIGNECDESLNEDDVSIATNSSTSVSVASYDVSNSGGVGGGVDGAVTDKFGGSIGLKDIATTEHSSNGKHRNGTTNHDGDNEDNFLRDFDENGSDSDDTCASISDDDFQQDVCPAFEGDQNRRPEYSVDSDDDFDSPIVVPLKTGIDEDDDKCKARRSGNFHRRPPPRTKSSDGMIAEDGAALSSRTPRSGNFSRRPPPRTKTGEGVIPGPPLARPEHRSPPLRTKSGVSYGNVQRRPPQSAKSEEGLRPGRRPVSVDKSDDDVEDGSNRRGNDYDVMLDSPDEDNIVPLPTSPTRRHRSDGREDAKYRAMALERNAARRQKSSDMLGAMRQATRNMPSRSKSNMATLSGGRRPPARSKSESPDSFNGINAGDISPPSASRRPVCRKPPSRTKSGGGLRGNISPRESSLSKLSTLRTPEVSLER
mmetsp:Transcript_24744/g.68274  ORF Transcript_24744/g.68274 Transcript_24744/m.68274 type:complete len:440 (+) Transcript_24744:691-2010(+)